MTAKLHGRQLRLEREQAGVREVSFGRGAKNVLVPGIVGFVLGGVLSFLRTRAARRR